MVRATHEKKLWMDRIADWQASEMSMTKWCHEQGVPYSRFYYWKQSLLSTNSQSLSFIELSDESSESGLVIHVEGIEIQLSKHFDAETLQRLLHSLQRSSC